MKYRIIVRREMAPVFVMGYNPDPRSFQRKRLFSLVCENPYQVIDIGSEYEYAALASTEPFLRKHSFDEFYGLAIEKIREGI